MFKLKKYLQISKMSWQSNLIYRLNFIMWRLRTLVLRLGSYFFWYAVYRFNDQVGNYNRPMMLTYILLGSVLQSLVLASQSYVIAQDIATGRLNHQLIRPLSYLKSMLALDLGDKLSNLFFLIFELLLIFLLFRPPFFIQTNLFYLLSFLLVSILALFIYFYLSVLVSLITFWYPEDYGWPARFLFMVINQFLSGGMMPLDILPLPIFYLLRLLPPAFFIFFPLQVYLGKIDTYQVYQGVAIMVFWLIILKFISQFAWKKGLRNFAAAGI
jgi:ABC-2 type transport system permease protein